jgi:hypothetical protein
MVQRSRQTLRIVLVSPCQASSGESAPIMVEMMLTPPEPQSSEGGAERKIRVEAFSVRFVVYDMEMCCSKWNFMIAGWVVMAGYVCVHSSPRLNAWCLESAQVLLPEFELDPTGEIKRYRNWTRHPSHEADFGKCIQPMMDG